MAGRTVSACRMVCLGQSEGPFHAGVEARKAARLIQFCVLAVAALILLLGAVAGFLAELCPLLHSGGFGRRPDDPGIAQRDSGPDHSADARVGGHDLSSSITKAINFETEADDAWRIRRKTGKMATTQVIGESDLACTTFQSKLRDYYTLTKPEVNLLILDDHVGRLLSGVAWAISRHRLAEYPGWHFAGGQRHGNA